MTFPKRVPRFPTGTNTGLHATERMEWATRDGMLHMIFKLGQCAEQNWRKLRGFDYLAKVITGVKFKDGVEATQNDQIAA